jgi:hypothetical protein
MWLTAIEAGLACSFLGDILVAEPAIRNRRSWTSDTRLPIRSD